MGARVVRKNEPLLRVARALSFAGLTSYGLAAMSFTPRAAALGIGLAVGVLAAFSPGIAVLVACIALALPLMAGNFLLGAVLLVIGFAAIQYLGQDNGRVYLLIILAFAAAQFGPVWMVPVIAGYLMGASEGAIAALIACIAIEVGGIIVGADSLGIIHTGGSSGLVSFASMPDSLITFAWASDAVRAIDPSSLMGAFDGVTGVPLLVAQPILWAAGAVVTAIVHRQSKEARKPLYGLLAGAAGIFTLAVGSAALMQTMGGAIPLGRLLAAGVTSLLASLVFIAASELVFPPLATRTASGVRSTVSDEDADVDELLRLISAAEDQLASKHTVNSVVMITDMKSFSKMTEEDGSVVSAKTIQRHRDLLLPVISSYRGSGKSTGGDGLLAAFDSPADALHAAVTMQRTLADYNAAHPSERDIIIRVGVASGEVVLDKGGRPFIGNALNLAARIMNLGDGGQIFTTREVVVAAKADDISSYSHGKYELKNIAEPVEVLELLWSPRQEPSKPRATMTE